MKDLEQARDFLRMAEKDWCALRGMANQELFSVEIFGFHVQQAVEKTLKAWLSCIGTIFPRTHDLDELASLLEDAGHAVGEDFVPLLEFTDFAVVFRYDAYPDLQADVDRVDIAERVGRLLEHVRKMSETG